ncbi:hypothetical protein ACFX14_003364 [Malus domestica]
MASPAREEKHKQAYQGLGAGVSSERCRFDGPPKQHCTIGHRRFFETLAPPTLAGSRSSSIQLSASFPPAPTASSPPSFANAFLSLSRLLQEEDKESLLRLILLLV